MPDQDSGIAAADAASEDREGTYATREQVESTSDDRTVNNVMRHGYRVLTDAEKVAMQQVKDMGLDFFHLIESLGSSREISLAKTKIEEAVMWAVKHVTA